MIFSKTNLATMLLGLLLLNEASANPVLYIGYKVACELLEREIEYNATQDDPLSQFNLGLINQYGCGKDEDYVKARYWYKKSAQNGYTKAQVNLSSLYNKGLGGKQESGKTLKWLRIASDEGDELAQKSLAIIWQGIEKGKPELVSPRELLDRGKMNINKTSILYAEEFIRRALEKFEYVGDLKGMASSHIQIAKINRSYSVYNKHLGDEFGKYSYSPQNAIYHFEEGAKIQERSDDFVGASLTLFGSAFVMLELGERESACKKVSFIIKKYKDRIDKSTNPKKQYFSKFVSSFSKKC